MSEACACHHPFVLQMAVLVCCEVLPTTVMTLPAAQGGLTASFQLYARHMRDWGVAVPSMGPALAALAITALLAASARLLEHAVSQQEYVSHCMPPHTPKLLCC